MRHRCSIAVAGWVNLRVSPLCGEAKMTANRRLLGVVAAAVMLGGCVTKSTYEKLETEKNQEIAKLQNDRQTLQKQARDLQQQIEGLETQRTALDLQKAQLERESVALQTQVGLLQQQRAALEQQKGTLEAQQAQLQQQVQALEQQKAQLQSASRQTQAQYDKLVGNLKEEVQKGQLQVRQYKDMLTVDVAEQL